MINEARPNPPFVLSLSKDERRISSDKKIYPKEA
jgi:hypothetical protein